MDSLFKHVEAQEKRSYLLRIEEEFGTCKSCEQKTKVFFKDKGRFIIFECDCGNYKKRVEL